MNNHFKISVFRAIDEPELCQEYLNGHQRVLMDYGITNVTTNNTDWMSHPYIYCTIAQNIITNEYVGGVRIQISDGKVPLPVESAVGYMDNRIHEMVKEYAIHGGISESCGLWTAKSVKGVGVARFLMWASVASSEQLKFKRMLGICGWHTLKLFKEIGFVIDKSLGNKGDFLYPTEEHIANVIGILDAVTLKNAAQRDKNIMLSLREQHHQQRTETNTNFPTIIEYNVEYNNITQSLELSENNYNLHLIKSLCNK